MLTLSWDELAARSLYHKDLSEKERHSAFVAFTELKRIFGHEFFDIKHPLFRFFINQAAWPSEWAIWFSRLLGSIKQHPDFPALIRDLRNPSSYRERMSILQIVDILLQSGFSFLMDKKILINGIVKKPDLFVQFDSHSPEFFIEVTSLGPGFKERQAHKVFDVLQEVFWPHVPELIYSGRCERVLSDIHLTDVAAKLQLLAKSATAEGFQALEIEGVIHLAAATKPNEHKLQNWANAHGLDVGEFIGPDSQTSELARLSKKLLDEQKQLPPDHTNVIFVYSHLYCSTPSSLETFKQFAQSIEEEIYRFPHVGYVILTFRWMGSNSNDILKFRDHICVNRQQFGFLCETNMLFKNRFAAKPWPSKVEEAFLAAFKTGGSAV